MGQKEEELKAAKDVAAKAEAELKDISQKHTQVDAKGGSHLTLTWITDREKHVLVLMSHCS